MTTASHNDSLFDKFWAELSQASWEPADCFAIVRNTAHSELEQQLKQQAIEHELGWIDEKLQSMKKRGMLYQNAVAELRARFPREIVELIDREDVDSGDAHINSATKTQPDACAKMSSGQFGNSAYRCPHQFNDNYILQEFIGSGGQGEVYKALHLGLDKVHALKVLRFDQFAQKERFIKDAKTIASIQHDGVIKIYAAGFGRRDEPYYSMELIEGGNLQTHFKSFLFPGARGAPLQRWSERQKQIRKVENLFGRLIEIFAFVALHVVNRDIKPANILLRLDGSPVVCDFGLAKSLAIRPLEKVPHGFSIASSNETKTQIAGTFPYMSPQQCVDPSRATPSDDLWSLGVILYELLTGFHPFAKHPLWPKGESNPTLGKMESIFAALLSGKYQIESPRNLNSGVSLDMSAMVMKCLRAQAPPSLTDSNSSDGVSDANSTA